MWKRVLSAVGVICVATTLVGAQSTDSIVDFIEFGIPGVTASGVCSMTQNECSFGVGQNNVYDQLSCVRADADCRSFVPDAMGFRYFWTNEGVGSCPGANAQLFRTRIGQTSELVLTIPACWNGLQSSARIFGIYLDAINGTALLNVKSRLGEDVIEIRGLPTLLDIIPTFQPASETLSWITPKHPEALPAAERFMVYAGDLAALREDGDFTRAVPVDCQVPDVGPPSPGEFLSILDPLPAPSSGEVSYVVVGMEHQGKLRFGRQSVGGVLSGRDPAAFRTCG